MGLSRKVSWPFGLFGVTQVLKELMEGKNRNLVKYVAKKILERLFKLGGFKPEITGKDGMKKTTKRKGRVC